MPYIASWLARLGLDKYTEAFTANEVDIDALRHLSEEDLRELGLPLGPRRRVLAAIAALDTMPRGSSASALAPSPVEAERRHLTVVFIDLVGSTEMSQRLDPEEMRDVLRAYQSAVSTEIAQYDGYVAKLMGDGVLAYFGWPRAHEDDAERAVRAGLAAAAATASLTSPLGKSLAARIGIATGLVVVGDLIGEGSAQEEAVVGDTPNLAARLQAFAEPSTVVIADSTQRLVAGLFEMIDLGFQQLKGFAAPVPAWRITGDADAEGRFDALHAIATPLVGRSEELELLLQRWEQTRTGKGQAVMLSGEPGIGKSRLTAALEERLSTEPHARLRYFCSPYHVNSALYPVIKQLARAAQLGRSDSTSAKLDKIEALILQSTADIGEAAPLLATLLSIDGAGRYAPLTLTPQAQKARTLSVLIQQLEGGITARQPVVMVVEDAHWIDPTTAEWLDMLIARLRDLRMLLIATFRPEYRPPWLGLSHVTALSLSPLGHDHGAAIVDRVAGGRILPLDVKNQILARTEGVPLFVEELTKTVLESGLLVDAGDHYRLKGPLSSLAIPSTLQDSLMARLDRLASVKNMAQIGACIGRVFHHRLLAAVAGCDAARLRYDLHNLEKSELVLRNGVAPEATYAFKHALVQDAAYQSLLKSRRHQIHAKIASTLEAQFPEIAETEPETLAHHYTAAELPDQAGEYWLKAGQQALTRSANIEALGHLGKGLEVVASLPSTEARLKREVHLQNAMGVAAMAVKGWGAPDVLHAFSSARKLCERLDDSNELFVAVRGEASYQLISGHLREADDLGRQCLQIAQSANDLDLLLEAHHQLWASKFFLGDYPAAEKHTSWGMATYNPDRDHRLTYIYTGHDPGVCCRNYSAQILWIRGSPDQALERGREALALSKRVSHSVSMATALNDLANVYLARREPEAALELAQQQLETSTKFDLRLMAGKARFKIGWALAQLGELAGSAREMRDALEATAATGAEAGMHYDFCILAQTYGELGDANEGLTILAKAFDLAAESGTKHMVSELLRTKGELLSRLDPHDGVAERWFQKSLGMARADGTKSTELRAATSLARFYVDQGRGKEGRKLLAPIYARFTEGFETGDLVDARALLDSLR